MSDFAPIACQRPAFYALASFVQGYVAAAFRTDIPSIVTADGALFSFDDLAPETLARMKEDCAKFERDNSQILSAAINAEGFAYQAPNITMQAGQDFWLSRNGHAGGFDSGNWPGEWGVQLMKAADDAGEAILYRGENGKIRHY